MKTTLFAITLTLLCISGASAQDDHMPQGKGRQRLEQLRTIKLIEALDLNEDQAIRLSLREKDFRESEKALFDKRKAVVKELRELIQNDTDDEGLKTQMGRITEIEVQIAQNKQKFLLSLSDFLTMQQIAKIILFEDRFRQEVRRLIEKAGRPPRR